MSDPDANLPPQEKIALAQARIVTNKKRRDEQKASRTRILDMTHPQFTIIEALKHALPTAKVAAPRHEIDPEVFQTWVNSANNEVYLGAMKALYSARMKEATRIGKFIDEMKERIDFDELLIAHTRRNHLR